VLLSTFVIHTAYDNAVAIKTSTA